ncbi:hypothetical protein KI387_033648 [Taxus chinensis]|uniref:DML1/Misato tubulin domain-containing protein n=1 Tax=Taxus chinensis TaxID=29808 RepID=A0AA38BY56_TAXCH|nr:hypothetical protein KI387_033648 [Taxus chinensis]
MDIPTLSVAAMRRPGCRGRRRMPEGTPTYTPRLLAIDSRGSLGAVSASGSLYKETSFSDALSVPTWDGSIVRYVSEPNDKNEFLQSLEEEEDGTDNGSMKAVASYSENGTKDRARIECLENGVQYWTDYSKVQFHPLSLYEIQGLWKDITPFDNFGNGRGILTENSQAEVLSDRLRFFVEECDHIQGFQFLVDDSGGFASVAADFVESVADEYARTPILMYTARDPSSYTKLHDLRSSMTRALHDAISFVKISSFSGLTVPVGLPSLAKSQASRFLCINDSKPFHSSAVYASTFHTATLPFRMEASRPSDITEVGIGSLDMDMMIRTLSHQYRQQVVASLDAAVPAPPIAGVQNRGVLERSLHSLTPNVADNSTDTRGAEALVIQGAVHSGRGGQAFISEVRDSIFPEHEGHARRLPDCHLSVSQCPLPIPFPFPCIFGNFIGQNGEILPSPSAKPPGRGGLDVLSIPIATRLRSSKAILPFLENRLQNLQNWGIASGSPGGHLLETWGLQKADVEDLGESLSEMVLSFDDSLMDTSSDSD